MFPTCSKTHEAAFFTKNDKKMIMKKEKNTLPPLKNGQILGGGCRINNYSTVIEYVGLVGK